MFKRRIAGMTITVVYKAHGDHGIPQWVKRDLMVDRWGQCARGIYRVRFKVRGQWSYTAWMVALGDHAQGVDVILAHLLASPGDFPPGMVRWAKDNRAALDAARAGEG